MLPIDFELATLLLLPLPSDDVEFLLAEFELESAVALATGH